MSEVIASIDEDVKSVITGQVLDALAMFEAHGLYHVDLRLWNVLFNPDDGVAHIIDYGALSPLPEDVMWPNDAYFSFLVWLVSLWGSFSDQPGLVIPRFTGIDRAEFPSRVISLISTLHDAPTRRTRVPGSRCELEGASGRGHSGMAHLTGCVGLARGNRTFCSRPR